MTEPTPAAAVCPWPVGTILLSTGAAFRWIFEHTTDGAWYEMGNEERRDWAYVATFPNLVELLPADRFQGGTWGQIRGHTHPHNPNTIWWEEECSSEYSKEFERDTWSGPVREVTAGGEPR